MCNCNSNFDGMDDFDNLVDRDDNEFMLDDKKHSLTTQTFTRKTRI